jgi:sterol desaturase/sphingolipid hydroxylase (fatty acid hydroxylase superfamily)
MDYYDDWFWKIFVLPLAEIAFIVIVFGHIDLYLNVSKSKGYQKLAIRENGKIHPAYKNLLIVLSINSFVTITLSYFLLQISPTHIDLAIYYEKNLLHAVTKFFDAIVIEQFYFYFSHRLFHWGDIYVKFHKLHHQAVHPYALTTVYCHVMELLFVTIPTIVLGVGITQMSWMLALVRYAYITLLTMLHHTGHNIIFDPSHHDQHHLTGDGNFAFMITIDKMFGTYIDEVGVKHEAEMKYWAGFLGLMAIRFIFF